MTAEELDAIRKRADADAGPCDIDADSPSDFTPREVLALLSALAAEKAARAEADALANGLEVHWNAAQSELTTLKARVAELEAGGCARDQGTTQYCAEAVALQKRVDELERALRASFGHLMNAADAILALTSEGTHQ